MKETLLYCILYALAAVAVIPAVGAATGFIVSTILRKVLSLLSRSGRLYLFVVNTLTFPGVYYHELSHALFAFLSGAKVNKIKLYEKKDGHLGYVTYTPRGFWFTRSIQLCLASCAPVIMGLIAEAILIRIIYNTALPTWGIVILFYLAFSILLHMDMSKPDIRSYLKGCPFFFLLAFVILFLTHGDGVWGSFFHF